MFLLDGDSRSAELAAEAVNRRVRVPQMDDASAAALGARVLRSLIRECGAWRSSIRVARSEGLLPLVRFAVERRAAKLENGDTTVRRPQQIAAGSKARAIQQVQRRAPIFPRFPPPTKLERLLAAATEAAAARLSRSLTEEGVVHAFTKGVATAPRYGRPYLRPMADIDVLVGPAGLDRVQQILARLGYQEVSRSEVGANFISSDPGRLGHVVDVHGRPDYVGQYAFPVEEMLSRRRPDGPVPVLAAEDELLVLVSHAARHRMRMVGRSECDIAVLTLSDDIDWDSVVSRAKRWRAAAATWAALSCARSAFGAHIPDHVLASLRPHWLQETYLRLWLDFRRVSPYRLGRRGFGGIPRRAAMLFLWPALMDGLARGAAFVARYSLRMLRRRGRRGARESGDG